MVRNPRTVAAEGARVRGSRGREASGSARRAAAGDASRAAPRALPRPKLAVRAADPNAPVPVSHAPPPGEPLLTVLAEPGPAPRTDPACSGWSCRPPRPPRRPGARGGGGPARGAACGPGPPSPPRKQSAAPAVVVVVGRVPRRLALARGPLHAAAPPRRTAAGDALPTRLGPRPRRLRPPPRPRLRLRRRLRPPRRRPAARADLGGGGLAWWSCGWTASPSPSPSRSAAPPATATPRGPPAPSPAPGFRMPDDLAGHRSLTACPADRSRSSPPTAHARRFGNIGETRNRGETS